MDQTIVIAILESVRRDKTEAASRPCWRLEAALDWATAPGCTVGAAASLGLPTVGKLLGSPQASTTARCAPLDADPLLRASESIAERPSTAFDGEGE